MKLKKLFKDIPVKDIKGSKDVEITGLCNNSKLVSPGNLFVARKGRSDDGAQYIPEAIEAGAAAVLTDIYDPSLKNITQIIHPNPNAIEGVLAAHYYQKPSDELFMVGITGTNGKTTTSFLVKYLLDKLNVSCGLIGTIEYIIGQHRHQATRTTPDVITNHKMLREMILHDCKAAVMEVTSHALDQGRVEYIDFDVAIFTNITLDHLDYHATMENYAEAKRKLFLSLSPHAKKSHSIKPKAVINADSPWQQKMVEVCPADVLTYGIENPADLKASDIKLTQTGTTFTVTYQKHSVAFNWPLIGRFNVYNALAAISVGLIRGQTLENLKDMMSFFPSVPGRLESVNNALGLKIYVDFAHSDDALLNVFDCLQELKTGRIITVFGCGGDRDRSKRPKMAQVCEEHSDICIITSDNPRSEDPQAICNEIISGFKSNEVYLVELDRRKAIEKAIEIATPDDIVLIAGKGHETYQMFAHKTIEFDDRKIAAEICQRYALSQV
jgi:UDP-N-acetylmuramoyl-L-alanyl-D-glutamate--2,6-diaminopimelate ligase